MHTPRLCVDARAGAEFPVSGIVAQEVVDQLVMLSDSEVSVDWVSKHRMVLLTHGTQVFSGQFKRHNTRVGLGKTLLHWAYSENFVARAGVSGIHEFRPIDRIPRDLSCPTVTTLLPAVRKLPLHLFHGNGRVFVVPSRAESDLLKARYGLPGGNCISFKPFVRRFVQFAETPKRCSEKRVLFLVDKTTLPKTKLITHVLQRRFRSVVTQTVLLDQFDPSPLKWRALLERTWAAFYLSERPMDWAVLALEALYFRVPVVFSDENAALSEILPKNLLRLSKFLVEAPNEEGLENSTDEAREQCERSGLFDPLTLAKCYADLFSKMEARIQ